MNNSVFEIKRSINFFLEKRKDKNGQVIIVNVPIRMSITYGGNRLMYYSGHRIDASKWDSVKQRAKNNTTHKNGVTHSDINDKLDRLGSGMNNYFKSCEVQRYMPSQEDLKDNLTLLVNDKKRRIDTFYTAFDDFIKTVGKENDWDKETFKKFSVVRNHLVEFDKKLTFEKFNSDRLLEYVLYLREKRNMRNTSIKKDLSFVRWFMRWAGNNDHPVNPTALTFQPKLKGTDGSIKKVIFLTIEELKHLHSLEFTKDQNYLRRVRDVFAFCCFTGLRYSDVLHLKKIDDKGGAIEFVAQKTSTLIRVELNKYSRGILDTYKDVEIRSGKALPVISNQKMNDYLKEIGKIAGFTKPETIVYFRGNERIEETYPKYSLLSSHSARKTFVTNLIYMGVSDHIIRQWTGHRDNKSFDVYHKMVDEIKSREMAKFDNI